MNITLLGDGCVLVEFSDANCIMDPLFFDPFEEGAVTSRPQRVVRLEELPPIHILIVSHRHPDSRRFGTLCELSPDAGATDLKPLNLPDLLMHYLLNVAPGSDIAARRHIDLELEALASGHPWLCGSSAAGARGASRQAFNAV